MFAMLTIVKSLFSPKVLLGLAVALACWWGYSQIKGIGYAEAEAELQPKIVALETAAEIAKRLAEQAGADYRAKESGWITTLKEQQSAYDSLQANHAKELARRLAASNRLLADNGRLRDDIAAYAATGGRPAADDSVASASARAAALGSLLAEALRLGDETLLASAESTAAAESSGDAVRALLRAWPK